jgi:deoxyribodipyrimidine photolyase-related protein
MTDSVPTLRLILGDQLNANHSWFRVVDESVVYLLAELHEEASYAPHHIQKLQAFFLAMHQFSAKLRQAGHTVIHLTLDDTAECSSLAELIEQVMNEHQLVRFEYQSPDEYRLRSQLETLCKTRGWEGGSVSTEHFLLSEEEALAYFAEDKQHRMEHFYRFMRKKFDVLMDNGKPVGDRWNFDQENRKRLPKKWTPPGALLYAHDVTEVNERLKRHGVAGWGEGSQPLTWPITVEESEQLARDFIARLLPQFGRYQDALTDRDWALYHARLSFSLNSKLLSPKWVIDQVVKAYLDAPDQQSLASIEGFVRQIMGWREYVRGIYLSRMPEYATTNALDNKAALPDYYWTGDTNMRCVAHAIQQTKKHAYAHHIQRLMVTGNLALLLGVHPDEVDRWYLGVYIDAIEWVEMPNTRGMSQYADGGFLASKPYVSSGKYIQRMSDYCQGCAYDVDQRHTDNACPFNSLYWAFLHRHRDQLGSNQRMRMMYANLDRIPAVELDNTLARADAIRQAPDAF